MPALPDKLYTAKQVRALDASAIEGHGIAGYELMQHAGKALFDAARGRFPAARRWAVVCGAGNNGGDGYVVARLAREDGCDVRVYALKPPAELRGDARTAADAWLGDDPVSAWPPGAGEGPPDLVVDALLGTGLDRAVEGPYLDAIEWMNRQLAARVAVDVPSGLNADTGQAMGAAVQADVTVTFIGLKRGLFTCDGPDCVGEVLYDALQVPDTVFDAAPQSGSLIHEKLLHDFPPRRRRNTHKGQFGHVLVVGGHPGMAGAARLAGEAALRCGSGLVSIATHPSHAGMLNLARPELMVSGVEDGAGLQALIARCNVIALGPGLGSGGWSESLLEACVAADRPLVVDADGLNLLARKAPERGGWVLTPHPAEAGRLLRCSAADVQRDRVGSAQALAAEYGAVTVLKGCGTVVADPGRDYAICPLGNPGMATAGSGDVLTGVIASLLGQGLDAGSAARLGVVIHGAAGDAAAARLGEPGMLAGDITDAIPALLA